MKVYNVILLSSNGRIISEQLCGSVTEVCKFLDDKYSLDSREMRKLLVQAFAVDTKFYYQFADKRTIRISQHKTDTSVQLHGCW